ncbi:PIN domain-containing protein [Bradyrhizobium sp. ARR65]|uniref:PIN domain-containing protein n=1 Tax=Bradyrhizobium sp. ARR65 TaxID=1040989 RepID=UPI00046670F3|nr:PIN domain-containing protein [Bradyrhizobium sp. ARR65]
MTKYVVLDTNTLLHYRRPDRLEWGAYFAGEEVILVITPPLIHELEQQKLANRSARLRRRANEIIQWLNGYLEKAEPIYVSERVRLHFYDESPRINFAAHRLSDAVPDDILIATTLQFREQMNVDVTLFTNDTGLRMKLRSRSIPAIKPRDEDRLADEPDETEIELERTRKELQRLQSRLPHLQLSFEDHTNFLVVELPDIQEEPAPKVRTAWYFGHSEEAISEYDKEYQAYLAEFQLWRSREQRQFLCQLVLRNTGSAEATNVSMDISFPEGVVPLKSGAKRPKPPRHPIDLAVTHFDPGELLAHVPERPSPLQPIIDATSRTVRWNIPSVVHNRTWELRPFLVRFESDPRGFQARITIGCVETIELFAGHLNFKIR